ncbi:MAG: phytoene/squalene synthase family protein [Actinomycetota bacterium]|nr:phytoene/squalene synthase family protein [Actinomycetota bacterium]
MSARELDAAGIRDSRLRASYERCRRLNAEHGKTYYLATLLLPPHKRPYVHALYGFARYADEFVDDLDAPDPQRLLSWGAAILADLDRGASDDAVAAALVDTARTWQLPRAHVEAFLRSMAMDITVTEYPTYADLAEYMYGSAAVIGLQMVPVLEPLHEEAYPRAQALGEAFQLTNFLRDVAEDLDRGRVYLPLEDLQKFDVTRADLERRVLTPAIRDLLRFEIERTRELYAYAAPGAEMLHPSSRDCIRVATTLYGGILDAIERADYQVFDRRVRVPLPRRLRVALPGLVRAQVARRAHPRRPRRGHLPGS